MAPLSVGEGIGIEAQSGADQGAAYVYPAAPGDDLGTL